MWYCAAHSNRHGLGYAQRQDGMSGWQQRSLFFPRGGFDAAIVQVNDHYEMITACSPDFYAVSAESGLWWVYSNHPPANPKKGSKPVQLHLTDEWTAMH